jgi:DNA-nicking Smr family endonuclease
MSEKDPSRFNDAFKQLASLKKQLAEKEAKPPPPPPQKAVSKPKPDDDERAFERAMSGVKKLGDDGRGERARPKEEATGPVRLDDDADALIALASSVDAGGAFAKGLDPRIVKSLERGELGIDDELDLHGMRRAEAEAALEKFLKKSRAAKLRCLLVVTGKGLHSDASGPVLGEAVRKALAKTFAAHVLAFCPARPEHGGEGALYVLLRRR